MLAGYERGLRWVLRHQNLVLLIAVGTLALNIYLYIIVPKGFFPQEDTGRIGGSARASQDISFDAMTVKQAQLAAIVQKDPGVDYVLAFAGSGGGGATTNVGRMFISLKPLSERDATADQIINRLRGKLSKIPGIQLFLQSSQDITHRRPRQRRAVSVHAAGFQSRRVERVGSEAARQDEDHARAARCLHRSAGERSRSATRRRSRYCFAPRPHHAGRGQRALRRLRPAPGLHHVHRPQSVLRRDGSGPEISARSGLAEEHLSPFFDRHERAALCDFALRDRAAPRSR